MILTNIHLRNFRNHDDLTVVLTKGVNAVVGPNGSGKSRVIEAIKFLLFGEGYGSKAEMLKTGEISGFVEGDIQMADGKVASLWRSIEDSKVKLTYDAKTYVKAGEVKALWQTLFNLDGNVFKNVNVASQGEIPKLFAGDEAERRAIFQKIFMVPNTAKLRDSIWNDYLKKAPVEQAALSEIEIGQKTEALALVEKDLKFIEHSISNLELFVIMSAEDVRKLQDEVYGAKQAIANTAKLQQLGQSLAVQNKEMHDANDVLAGIDADLEGAPELSLIEQMDRTALTCKAQNEQQAQLNAQLDAVVNALLAYSAEDLESNELTLAALETQIADLQAKTLDAQANVKAYELQKAKLSKLDGHHECPTCGGALHDVCDILAHTEKELLAHRIEHVRLTGECQTLMKHLNEAKNYLAKHQQLAEKQTQLVALIGDVEPYSAEDHAGIREAIVRLKALLQQQATAKQKLALAMQAVANVQQQIAAIPMWNHVKYTSPEELIGEHELALEQNRVDMTNLQNFKLKQQAKEFEKAQIVNALELSERNKAVNEKRATYVNGLQKLYDVLHPSQFAALLIQSYSSTLEGKLTKYLSQFNFRYSVVVSETFDLHVYNEDGEKLPDVSGGEKMVIGLCLRLALHEIFSQSLSMILIDEPTQGLDVDNQGLLFDAVAHLKNSGIEQTIIIDHNPGLARVVDNVIVLTK